MSANLRTYLQDHLAGAQFATPLLAELVAQEHDADIAKFASNLLTEIEDDKRVVENILARLDTTTSVFKEASAWIAQKLGRAKLQIGSDPFSIFEALEVLSIGIQGKFALWTALEEIAPSEDALRSLDLTALCERAAEQHGRVECQRIAYARSLIEA